MDLGLQPPDAGDSALSDCVPLDPRRDLAKRRALQAFRPGLSVVSGVNEFIGEPLDQPRDCGWTFMGYAVPLLEPYANESWWALSQNTRPWSSNLDYHVSTTSTSTVWLRQDCVWRLYMQGPALVPDDRIPSSGEGVSVPRWNPADHTRTSVHYPTWNAFGSTPSWSQSTERFSSRTISYVDSPDGGVHFPIFAPTARGPIGQPPLSWDWREAGWTNTAVPYLFPCAPDPTTVSGAPGDRGIFARYQDVTILDLKEEIGWYVMVAIEARTRNPGPIPDPGDFEQCPGPRGGGHSPDSVRPGDCTAPRDGSRPFPYTRVVLFFCEDAGFGSNGTPVYPPPGVQSEAAVLLAPEWGGGPGHPLPDGSDCPNEWFGVPNAVVDPDRRTVRVFVPWQGTDADGFAFVPSRLRVRFPSDDAYRRVGSAPIALFETGVGGISAFALDVADLGTAASPLRTGGAEESSRRLQVLMDSGYQGEVLISNGSTDDHLSRDIPVSPDNSAERVPAMRPAITDPQFIWIAAGGTHQLWVYWDSEHPLGPTVYGSDQLWCAHNTTVAALEARAAPTMEGEPASYQHALMPNGPLTLFLAERPCDLAFDLRQLFIALPESRRSLRGPPSLGKLVADPDLAQLGDGRLRATFFGGASTLEYPPGLLYALGRVEIPSGLSVPDTSVVDALAERT